MCHTFPAMQLLTDAMRDTCAGIIGDVGRCCRAGVADRLQASVLPVGVAGGRCRRALQAGVTSVVVVENG